MGREGEEGDIVRATMLLDICERKPSLMPVHVVQRETHGAGLGESSLLADRVQPLQQRGGPRT